MIYYSYRQPPTYDEKLNHSVLQKLTWAPVYFLGFGYWMLSNKQLFSNECYPFTYSDNLEQTNHIWYDVFTSSAWTSSPALPLLWFFWIALILTAFRDPIYNFFARRFPSFIKVGDIELDEDLPNYFETLDDHDRNWSIKEEEVSRKNLKMNILSDHTMERLRTTVQGNSHLEGVHTYDVLANILYVDDFQYFSPSMEDRTKYIIDDDSDEDNDEAQSDLVRMVTNLAYLTEEEAKKFSFDKNQYKNAMMKKLKTFAINKLR